MRSPVHIMYRAFLLPEDFNFLPSHMKKLIPFLLITFLMIGCDKPTPTELNLPLPKSYTITKSNSSLVIDGKADEDAWQQAEWTDYFIDIEGDKKPAPYYQTRMKMLWDDEFIYFYAEMEEEHVWGDITQRDAVIFHNNDFEIFIRPNQFQPYYGEFEVNVLGTIWELFLARPYRRNGPVLDHWDINGQKVGIDVKGTINDPSDTDERWSVEWAIPVKPLTDVDRGTPFGDESTWRINFSRVQWQHTVNDEKYSRKHDDEGNRLPENNWVWTQQSAIDMHRPEHWGYLYFVDEADKEVTEDPYQNEYQLLYHLYRKQLDWLRDHNTFTGNISDLEGPEFLVNGEGLTASLTRTKLGFEITVHSDAGDLTLNQDGYLNSQ